MKAIVVIPVVIVLLVGVLLFFGFHQSKVSKHNGSDTSTTWIKYFTSVGAVNKDTETFAIRVTKDTNIIIANNNTQKFEKQHIVDSSYYVPYDSLYKCDTCPNKTRVVKIFVLLPKT